jgi:hypothetical protein
VKLKRSQNGALTAKCESRTDTHVSRWRGR